MTTSRVENVRANAAQTESSETADVRKNNARRELGAAVAGSNNQEDSMSLNYQKLVNLAKERGLGTFNHLYCAVKRVVGNRDADMARLVEWRSAGVDKKNVDDEIVESVERLCAKPRVKQEIPTLTFGAEKQPTCAQVASVLARFRTMEWDIPEGVDRFRRQANHPSKGGVLSNAGAIIGFLHADVKTQDYTEYLNRVLFWRDENVSVLGSAQVENETLRLLLEGDADDDLAAAVEMAANTCYPAPEPEAAANDEPVEPGMSKCPICGTKFPSRKGKVYFSRDCQRKAYYERARARKNKAMPNDRQDELEISAPSEPERMEPTPRVETVVESEPQPQQGLTPEQALANLVFPRLREIDKALVAHTTALLEQGAKIEKIERMLDNGGQNGNPDAKIEAIRRILAEG